MRTLVPGRPGVRAARTLEAVRRDLGVLLAPRLLPLHLLGVAATVAAVLLGLWQLNVWQAHREAEARDLTSLAPVPLSKVLGPDQPFPNSVVGRRVDISGEWLPRSTFYVMDRDLDGRRGFWVVTPVAVCADAAACRTSSALLVVRGWTADPAHVPAAPEGRVSVTGWLQPPEGSGVPDPDPTDNRLPELRIADAVQRVDQDLYGAFLIAEDARPAAGTAGLRPLGPESAPQVGTTTGLRNFLYAVQWWVFAGFALVVWWRWARDEVERSRQASSRREGRTPEVPSNP
jgi:cytochrome oxidase assembly protein ShyY1